jgi:mannose-6-phosphate isomerase-like protein (cupin superfamily)
MTGFHGNIEQFTLENENFRKVLYTGKYLQLVVMTLQAGEEIGKEVHDTVDQFFRVEAGEAKFVFNNTEIQLAGEDEVVIVPAGTWHNVINNSSSEPLKLYTIYAPPNHPDGTIHKDKAEADEAEEHEHH